MNIKEKVNITLNETEKMFTVINQDTTVKELQSTTDKLKNVVVRIGVTGIIKAGKSTLLNALLHKDILGTAVVPETANLTIIKYSPKEKAKVFFWSQEEWDDIQKKAQNSEDLLDWIDETKENIDNIEQYIQQKSIVKDIKIEELPLYTSAKKKYGSICNLVKFVELYTPLSFIENNVEIIDTPGIDDPVIHREQITQNFLTNCDVMIHTMNASQAFSNQDAMFIIDNILANSISKLILVITRKDQISASELQEVEINVKKSLNNKFNEYKSANEHISKKLNNILEKIEFCSISGKDALNHRIDKKDKTTLSLEESGINEFESILERLLFDDNPQYNLMFDTSKNKLIEISNNYQKELSQNLFISKQSKLELEQTLLNLKVEKNQYISDANNLKIEIDSTIKHFDSSLNKLQKSTIKDLDLMKVKVFNDINNYIWKCLENDDKPDEETICI